MNNALMFSKASDEWSTPDDLFAPLHREFKFGLDAAATYENTKCLRFLGTALELNWHEFVDEGESVWLNPPYSKCREFIAKAKDESVWHGLTVVCLVPSRTDTKWWHDYVWGYNKPQAGVEVRFIRGRVKFGDGKNSAPFPSVVIIFRGQR